MHAAHALGRNKDRIAQVRKELAEAENLVASKEMQLRILLADTPDNNPKDAASAASSMPKAKAARTE